MPADRPVLREMRPGDVPAVLEAQEPAAVAALSHVFPQDRYPFPREVIADRWREEVDNPEIHCWVVERGGRTEGFAALRGDEIMHFGVSLEQWGSGLAQEAHDELLARLREHGFSRAWLCVYAGNARGRRFWERLGWRDTGERSRGPLPPHAELLTYEKPLS